MLQAVSCTRCTWEMAGAFSKVATAAAASGAANQRCRCFPAPPTHHLPLQAQAAAELAPPQGDDVYAYEPQPLEEGVRKHMLSVFVAGGCCRVWVSWHVQRGCRKVWMWVLSCLWHATCSAGLLLGRAGGTGVLLCISRCVLADPPGLMHPLAGCPAFVLTCLFSDLQHPLPSSFIADEPGLINRVAGVFARRGANIESLAVGLTVDKALFTVVASGTDATVANLSKQVCACGALVARGWVTSS